MGRLEKWSWNVNLFLLFQCLVVLVKAEDTTYVQWYDLYSKNLSKSEMQTSVLYDRIYGIAKLNPQQYTVEEREEIPKDYKNWKQVYLEMYLAEYNNSSKLSFENLLQRATDFQISTNSIPIGIINYRYDYIDSNAVYDGRIKMIDNMPTRNNMIARSPFLQDSVCILSIMGDRLYTGYSKFKFDKSFYFTNTNQKIKNITLNFHVDQSTVLLNPGDSISILFNTTGARSYTYTILYENGKTIKHDGIVNVVSSGTAPCFGDSKVTTAEMFYDYDKNTRGAVYEFGVYRNNCFLRSENELRKPILIFDGFDPSDSRKIGNIFDKMNEAPHKFADSLLDAGHDIVICNFKNGADFIERNALAVIDLIKFINARTSDKIVVIGPSMGGLVLKYALAKMEKENINHNTSLYISFDSPHQGANIPIGDQNFLYFFGEVVGDANALEGLAQINSAAAKQMLMHHYLENSITPKYTDYRKQFLDNCKINGKPNSSGYPLALRKIALINGSGNVELQGVNGKLFSMEKYKFGFLVAEAQVYSSPNIGTSKVGYYMAANPNDLTHPRRLYKYASVVPGSPYPINIDDAPGGYFNTQEILTGLRSGQSNGLFNVIHDKHCFIPTTSSLDIKFPTEFVNYKLDVEHENLVCDARTPFDAYYAPNHNESHITITKENAIWLRREIKNAFRTVEAVSNGDVISNAKVFNYGRATKNFCSKSVSIEKDGVLGVNMNSETGFLNEAIPITGSSFTVETYNSCTENLVIEIKDKGKIILGDANSNIGKLILADKSSLNLLENSTLSIYNNSTLLIKKGAHLLIGKNTKIELLGPNARIILEGGLEVLESAKFTFVGQGYITIASNDIVLQKDAEIDLKGFGKNNLLLQLSNSAKVALPYILNSFNKISITNGKILSDNEESYINTAVNTELKNVSIVNGSGIIINGQPNVIIEDCDFINTRTGITGYLNSIEKYNISGNLLRLKNCSFSNNNIAVKVFGKGFDLQNITIQNCSNGIIADGQEYHSKLLNTTIDAGESQHQKNSSNAGVSFIGSMACALSLDNAIVSKYNTGINISQSSLNLKCSQVIKSQYQGLWIANHATLNLSPSLGVNAGNNVISVNAGFNNKTILLDQALAIHLENGSNQLKLSSSADNYFVAGTMLNIPQTLNVQKNNWYTSLTTNSYLNAPAQQNFIVHQTASPSSAKISNYSIQPILGNTNTFNCNVSNILANDPCYPSNACMSTQYFDPLVYSKNSETINIANYSLAPYNVILKTILTQIKTDENDLNISNRFLSLCDLYSSTEKYDSSDVVYLKDLTYTYVQHLFNRIYELKCKQSSASMILNYELCLVRYEDLLNKRIALMKKLNKSDKACFALLDLAQFYTKTANFELANLTYNEALSNTENQSLINLTNHWMCISTLKENMIYGSYSIEQLDSMWANCTSSGSVNSYAGRNVVSIDSNFVEVLPQSISIFPNPANNTFTIALRGNECFINIKIYTIHNQLVKSLNDKFKSKMLDVDLSDIESGIYYVQVETNEGVHVYKIIKK